MTFVIEGAPRTKKNSQRIFRHGGKGRPFVVASAQSCAWQESAVFQLRAAMRRCGPAWEAPCNLRALVYRERRTGDLGNYLAAVCDALQAAGVVVNDKWILGFDGSRLLADSARPRVEIELTALDA